MIDEPKAIHDDDFTKKDYYNVLRGFGRDEISKFLYGKNILFDGPAGKVGNQIIDELEYFYPDISNIRKIYINNYEKLKSRALLLKTPNKDIKDFYNILLNIKEKIKKKYDNRKLNWYVLNLSNFNDVIEGSISCEDTRLGNNNLLKHLKLTFNFTIKDWILNGEKYKKIYVMSEHPKDEKYMILFLEEIVDYFKSTLIDCNIFYIGLAKTKREQNEMVFKDNTKSSNHFDTLIEKVEEKGYAFKTTYQLKLKLIDNTSNQEDEQTIKTQITSADLKGKNLKNHETIKKLLRKGDYYFSKMGLRLRKKEYEYDILFEFKKRPGFFNLELEEKKKEKKKGNKKILEKTDFTDKELEELYDLFNDLNFEIFKEFSVFS